MSGRRTGKSNALACVALWFYCSFPGARVTFTAPSNHQIKDILWHELSHMLANSKAPIPHGGRMPKLPSTGIADPVTGAEIKGITARDAESLQGIAGKHLLFIVDEASGVDDFVFEAILGNRAGGAGSKVILTGNPTRADGEFYRAFHEKSAGYHTIHIDSREGPNMTGKEPTIHGLMDPGWEQQIIERWGKDSSFYLIHIAGKFVVAEDAKIFPCAVLDLAQARWHDENPPADERLWIGLDPAGEGEGGDETAIAPRRGRKLLDIVTRRGLNEAQIIALVLDVIATHRRPIDAKVKPIVVFDSEGRVGVMVQRALEEHCALSPDFELAPVRAGKRATRMPRVYHLIRDELAHNAREWFRGGGAIPEHYRLYQELHTLEFVPGGPADSLYKITPKDGPKGLRKLLGRSPDSYDAFVLSVWEPITVRVSDAKRGVTPATVYETAPTRDVATNPYKQLDWLRYGNDD